MITHIGITGTRNGMNDIQEEMFIQEIEKIKNKYPDVKYFHQGQCVGVDIEAAKILYKEFAFTIISHPPIKKELIGYCIVNEKRNPKTYFARNRDIVHESEILFVIPQQESRQSFGGTWYTYDYGIKHNKPVILILPSGKIRYYNMENIL